MPYCYKKSVILLFLIIGFQTIKAQILLESNSDSTAFKTSKKFKTLKINTTGYSLDLLGELKDELISWKEKVKSINIDEKNNEMEIIHNLYMDEKEFFEVLKKYNITKASMISYQ